MCVFSSSSRLQPICSITFTRSNRVLTSGWLAGCLVVEPNFSICRNVILFLFLSVHLPLSLFFAVMLSLLTLARSLVRSLYWHTEKEQDREGNTKEPKPVGWNTSGVCVCVCVCVCHWSTSVSIGRSVGRLVCWCRSIGIWAPVLATSFIIFSFFSVLLVLLLLIQ